MKTDWIPTEGGPKMFCTLGALPINAEGPTQDPDAKEQDTDEQYPEAEINHNYLLCLTIDDSECIVLFKGRSVHFVYAEGGT